jgi:hypothetical protein
MVFWRPLGKLRYRILYAVIAYGVFAASFLPWWGDPASRDGIVKNVFAYRAPYGMSWIGNVIGDFGPIQSADAYLAWIPKSIDLRMLWSGFMVLMGIILIRRGIRELYLVYLMLLFASSPAMATQYTAVPMIAVASCYAAWESWAFMAAATLGILLASNNVGGLIFSAISHSSIMQLRGRPYNLGALMDVSACPFFLAASQFCVGFLLYRQWRKVPVSDLTLSVRFDFRRTVALVATGGLPVLIAVVRKSFAYGPLAK